MYHYHSESRMLKPSRITIPDMNYGTMVTMHLQLRMASIYFISIRTTTGWLHQQCISGLMYWCMYRSLFYVGIFHQWGTKSSRLETREESNHNRQDPGVGKWVEHLSHTRSSKRESCSQVCAWGGETIQSHPCWVCRYVNICTDQQ